MTIVVVGKGMMYKCFGLVFEVWGILHIVHILPSKSDHIHGSYLEVESQTKQIF